MVPPGFCFFAITIIEAIIPEPTFRYIFPVGLLEPGLHGPVGRVRAPIRRSSKQRKDKPARNKERSNQSTGEVRVRK